jgi:formylglycine-generating enzyme required for sulfatase activity
MRFIPAAGVVLGSGSGPFAIDMERTATVAPFYMDATEVTAGAYEACVAAGPCTPAHTKTVSVQCNYQRPGAGAHPINCVTHAQAVAYCASVGKRLPTDDEWEYAARGTDRRRYPWGDTAPTTQPCWPHGRSKDDGARGTCRAGSRTADASPFGVLDLSGNVSEWTGTIFCSFNDPKRCSKSAYAVRGGSWDSESAASMDVEQRIGFPPASGADARTGFRCVRSVNACAKDEDCACTSGYQPIPSADLGTGRSPGDCIARCRSGACSAAQGPM